MAANNRMKYRISLGPMYARVSKFLPRLNCSSTHRAALLIAFAKSAIVTSRVPVERPGITQKRRLGSSLAISSTNTGKTRCPMFVLEDAIDVTDVFCRILTARDALII